MKSSVRLKRFVPLTVLSGTLLLSPQLDAGLISLLKGDQPEQPPKPLQRVGFIGCAKVKEVAGKVEYLNGIDHWIPLKVGTHLHEGDLIRTSDGQAVLRMCESTSLVKLTPRTLTRLIPLNSASDRASLTGSEDRPGYIVRSLRGKAYIQSHGDWKTVAVNDVLPKGALVRTDESATLDVFNARDGRILRIHSGGETQLGAESPRPRDRFVAIAGGK